MSKSGIKEVPIPQYFEQLFCPVCFDLYEGRVLQCSQGHSLCEQCEKAMIKKNCKTECPQCRCAFVGTRNYAIEELVKQIRLFKDIITINNVDPNSNPSTSNNNGNNRKDDDFTLDHQKLNTLMTALVVAMNQPSKKEQAEQEAARLASLPPRSVRSTSTAVTPEPTTNPWSFLGDELQAEFFAPPQPRGIFTCRIGNCFSQVPVCRMLNHVRTFHIANFTRHRLQNEDDEFVMHYTFRCQDFRQFIHIAQYGLFFLIVNVKRIGDITRITSWVQCVGRGTECSAYTFNLQMRVENSIAHFTDYTYGESSDALYIETKKQCLYYETTMMPKRISDLAIDVKITRSLGERTGRRRTVTTLMPISN